MTGLEYTAPHRGLRRVVVDGWEYRYTPASSQERRAAPPVAPTEPTSETIDTHGLAIPYGLALRAADGGSEKFRYGCCQASHGRRVPLLVEHDERRRVGSAVLVDGPDGLKFRAVLDPCAERRIGSRSSISPGFIARSQDDTLYGDTRVVYQVSIEEVSIVERGRWHPHTLGFNLAAAVADTWPERRNLSVA